MAAIQTTTLFERPEYWEESWRLGETCCLSNSSERISVKTDVKNSRGLNDDSDKYKEFKKMGIDFKQMETKEKRVSQMNVKISWN